MTELRINLDGREVSLAIKLQITTSTKHTLNCLLAIQVIFDVDIKFRKILKFVDGVIVIDSLKAQQIKESI